MSKKMLKNGCIYIVCKKLHENEAEVERGKILT